MPSLVLSIVACSGQKPVVLSSGLAPSSPEAAAAAPAPTLRTLSFVDVALPPDAATMREPVGTTRATLDGVEVPVTFHTLIRPGDLDFGRTYALGGEPLPDICQDQDFNALLLAGGQPWLVSHFECVPGATYVSALSKAQDGTLSLTRTAPISWDAWGGVWFPCSGQVSPWGTHLGSEEFEPDARQWRPDGTLVKDDFQAWDSFVKIFADKRDANPYAYGWALETTLADDGTPTPEKHMAMGRFSHELSFALPDRKTVYQSDDGTAVGFFLFVADVPGDLGAGKLYAAKFDTGPDGVGTSWIDLGHATHGAVKALVDARPTFGEIFEVADPTEQNTCPEGFTYVHHGYGRECLKLAAPSAKVPDPVFAASRLETRRYAAMLGASTELEKSEGLTFDPETGTIYLALSNVRSRMLEEPGEPTDGVRVAANPCGEVWGGTTAAGVTDTTGAPIASEHVVTRMRPALRGRPLEAPDAGGNGCATDAIANPDNLAFLPGYGLLTIAEDTKWKKGHTNAVLWVFDVRTQELSPILVAPPGGEMTGIHWIPDLLGHGYLTAVVQHPWSELPKGQPVPEGIGDAEKRSFTGYFGPFPKLAR